MAILYILNIFYHLSPLGWGAYKIYKMPDSPKPPEISASEGTKFSDISEGLWAAQTGCELDLCIWTHTRVKILSYSDFCRSRTSVIHMLNSSVHVKIKAYLCIYICPYTDLYNSYKYGAITDTTLDLLSA